MNYKALIWKIVTHAAAIAGAIVPVLVSYDLQDVGEHPSKHLELTESGSFHPLRDLSDLAQAGKVSLQVGTRTFQNLFIVRANLHNSGKAPVLASDYDEKLSVSVTAPWEIVAVKNSEDSKVPLKWNVVNKEKYESEPALLNPGDITTFTIYLTNDSLTKVTSQIDTSKPKLKWHTRIVNLAELGRPDLRAVEAIKADSRRTYLFVHLSDWKLLFFCIACLVDLAVILFLLFRSGIIRTRSNKSVVLWTLAAVCLSASAAECASTYFFGNSLWSIGGYFFISEALLGASMFEPLNDVNHWINGPPLILNSIALICLLNCPQTRRRKRPEKKRVQAVIE